MTEDWLASARAEAMRIDYPRVKLIVSPEDDSILGCHLVVPESSTLLHQVMAVMRLKNDFRELANMIYIHPALNECLLAAAVKAVGALRKRGPRLLELIAMDPPHLVTRNEREHWLQTSTG